MRCTLPGLLLLLTAAASPAADGNRLTYLDENNPYYVSRRFPRLVTPQWVGEEGVEAVVILAIDDMRGPDKWEAFLRPILRRLQRIDGRAPVSIMTCQIDPRHPHLQTWLKEGLSLECHTFDHPCPFFKDGDLAKAKATYDRCVDLLNEVPGNHPVAFRMPCCDSLNTPSPRFYAEIFNKTTPKGHFLSVDSSVFNVFTSNDTELPRDLVIDPDGRDRFRKYLPADRAFVNTIEDYPYPYVLNRLCWEFPCVTPSDWAAQHLHKPNNPITVRDWQAALDATVIKQGVFTMVFHPHGWIKSEQIVELIDHAVAKHGKKLKFLTFREALERLNKNLLGGQPLRYAIGGGDNGVRLIDVNNDGYLDVVIGNEHLRQTRVWSPKTRSWNVGDFPGLLHVPDVWGGPIKGDQFGRTDAGARFGIFRPGGNASLFIRGHLDWAIAYFDGQKWLGDGLLMQGLQVDHFGDARSKTPGIHSGKHRFIDLDHDGRCELIGSNGMVYGWFEGQKRWERLPFTLPGGMKFIDEQGRDTGVRFLDINEDGYEDIVYSNEREYGVYLFTSMKDGWSRKVMVGKRGDPGALPMITNNGTDNGMWVHSRHLWWSNENTPLLKDHVDRRSFNDLLSTVEPEAKSAEASLRSLRARPGFVVEQMAAEPLVQSPIAFAWGPDGKLWVVEMGDYPLGIDGKGKFGGRVKFLESTHGDGKYDKATVFLDGLGFPTGVMPWGKGVLVTCAPEILYAEGTDGDGKADVRRPLYTGFVEGNQQHRVNGLVWGLDNWIYCANGDSGGRIRSVKTGAVVDIRGRDLRIRPDEGALDAESGQTQYGRGRDDWGNWFGGNNSNPVWHYVLADHYLRRNPHVAAPDLRVPVSVMPGVAPVYPVSRTLPRFNDLYAFNRFTSACSPIVYRDELFGPHFANNTFVSEPVHNLVHREVMTPDGITFTSRRAADEQQSEFLASSDNWFRPTMIQTGPDGALWVADMYRHVIEHPQWIPPEWQKKLDLRAGHDKGRIYRVYPVGQKPRAIPRLDRLDTAGLVAALDSPNGWQRDMAQQLLVRRGDKAAIPLLEKQARESGRPLCRLHALCTLDGLGSIGQPALRRALADPHPGVRRHAIRLCESRSSWPAELAEVLPRLLADPDPQVRLQLACTLGTWPDATAGRALGHLALQAGSDRYFLTAVLSSVTKNNLDPVLEAVMGGTPSLPLIESLLRLANALGHSKATATLLNAVAASDKGQYTAGQLTALAGLLDALDRGNTSLARLGESRDAELQAALCRIAALFGFARTLLANNQADRTARLAAVGLLGRGPDRRAEDLKLLASLLSPQTGDDLQAAAVAELGRLRDPAVPQLLLQEWKSLGPALRRQVLDVLLQREAWAKAVLDALERKQILPSELDAAGRQRLLGHPTVPIRDRAVRLLAGTVNADRQKVLNAFQPVLTMRGDAGRGVQVFAKVCANCHRFNAQGHEVGPDLGSLADKSPESLLIAILDPNRAVEARYVNYYATTRNGQTFTGVLASETGTSITLLAPEGKKQVILRSDLESLASTDKSLMPEGLEKDLKAEDFADVIAYLRAGAAPLKPKTFEGNRPELVQPAADGSLGLLASNCAIYGRTLVLEKQYGNLGAWSSEDDRVVWSAVVPRAGRYAVWLEWACDDSAAGNTYLLQAGLQRLTGTVAGTGTWDRYRYAKVGEITLQAGEQQIVFRGAGKIAKALIDLKSIRLIPMTPP